MPFEPVWLIEQTCNGGQPSPAELRTALKHVAQAGFDWRTKREVTEEDEFVGYDWCGREVRLGDKLGLAEWFYLKLWFTEEWPEDTTFEGFVSSIVEVILDRRSYVFVGSHNGECEWGIMRRSEKYKGVLGYDWLVVYFLPSTGHWVKVVQLKTIEEVLRGPAWTESRWLISPPW